MSPRSIFRTAMQVSPEIIARMNEGELNILMNDLFRVQAYRCKSSLSEIYVNTQDKASDDGCDGWTAEPEVPDDWLGDANTCWQFKTGTAGQPSKLKGEVLKKIPMETLNSGGRFVVITSGSTSGRAAERRRLKVLRDEAESAGIPTDKIDVFGSERLTNWCNLYPAVAAIWAGIPTGILTIAKWSRAEDHQVPWQASDSLEKDLATQREALSFETGTIQHLHIHGQPGVGKSRLALELCRHAPWSGFVIYVPQATDHGLGEIINDAADDPNVRLVVVADEVQPKQLRQLRESIGYSDGRIRLITIGHCPTPDPLRSPAFLVNPLSQEQASNVVKGWYGAMPPEHVDFIVRFACGYVRLAKLASDAVAKDADINVHQLLDQEGIRSFLDGMFDDGDRRALHVVSVLSSIGWNGDVENEGKAVADHLGLDWKDVRFKVSNCQRRYGIAPRGGRYLYISPTPLGNYLAVDAWNAYPEIIRTLPDVLPSEGAKEAYYERLKLIASNPQVRDFAREELDSFFRLADFVDERAVRQWSALSAADPDRAARNIFCALTESSVEDRLKIEDRTRRGVVWALVRFAWRSSSFCDAVKALALLAEAENESWSNNATSEFISRFQIFLGGTAVPYLDRLSVLDDLISENRLELNRLIIKALVCASNRQAFRMGSDPASDDLPEKEWQPSTWKEQLESIQAALQRLIDFAEKANPELQEDFIDAGKEFAMMLRDEPVRPLVERFFNAIHTAYPDSREALRSSVEEIILREKKYWKDLSKEELGELEKFHTSLEDASLLARLRQHVGQSHWEREEQPDLNPLAKELLECEGGVAEAWSWLTSGEAGDAWRFGEALANEDKSKELAVLALSFKDTGPDFRVLCGYINVCRQEFGDEWYDKWVESLLNQKPVPIGLIFEIAWRCGTTVSVGHHLVNLLTTESVAPELAGQLAYGGWSKKIAPDLLDQLLHAMVTYGHLPTAASILSQRVREAPEEVKRWQDIIFELITTPEIIRSSQMTSYHWKELALKLVNDYTSEIVTAIFREQGDRSEDSWFIKHSNAHEVLQACAASKPEAVWAAMLPHLSSRRSAFSFGLGFPRGVLDQIPHELVFNWIEEQPEDRAPMVARLTLKSLVTDETLAAKILGAYGEIKSVASAFFSEYISGSWTGPSSNHWEELALEMDEVVSRTNLPKLRTWARNAARSLRQMAEQERQHEEEEKLRGF